MTKSGLIRFLKAFIEDGVAFVFELTKQYRFLLLVIILAWSPMYFFLALSIIIVGLWFWWKIKIKQIQERDPELMELFSKLDEDLFKR